MVSQYIKGQQTTWDELLLELILAINNSIKDSTGFSPAQCVEEAIGPCPRPESEDEPRPNIAGLDTNASGAESGNE